MKKLLSLLSVLTISGTAIPTTIAASPYQKEENKLETLNRNKRSGGGWHQKENINSYFRVTNLGRLRPGRNGITDRIILNALLRLNRDTINGDLYSGGSYNNLLYVTRREQSWADINISDNLRYEGIIRVWFNTGLNVGNSYLHTSNDAGDEIYIATLEIQNEDLDVFNVRPNTTTTVHPLSFVGNLDNNVIIANHNNIRESLARHNTMSEEHRQVIGGQLRDYIINSGPERGRKISNNFRNLGLAAIEAGIFAVGASLGAETLGNSIVIGGLVAFGAWLIWPTSN